MFNVIICEFSQLHFKKSCPIQPANVLFYAINGAVLRNKWCCQPRFARASQNTFATNIENSYFILKNLINFVGF